MWCYELIPKWFYQECEKLARKYLFDSTTDAFKKAFNADDFNEASKFIRNAANNERTEFLFDMFMIAVALLATLMTACCAGRCIHYFCFKLPKTVRDANAIRAGTKPYQVKAREAATQKNNQQKQKSIKDDLNKVSQAIKKFESVTLGKAEDKSATSSKPNAKNAKSTASSSTSTSTSTSSSSSSMSKSKSKFKSQDKNKLPSLPHQKETQPTSITAVKTPSSTPRAKSPDAESYVDAARKSLVEHVPVPRTGTRSTSTSVIRGYPEVDLLITSPGQKYLLISCRSKRRTCIYSQHDSSLLEAKVKEHTCVSVEDAIKQAHHTRTHCSDDNMRVEVYSAAFTSDDARVIVGERDSDTFYVFAVAMAGLTHISSFKLPDRRLVSSLPRWGLIFSDALFCPHNKNCEMELISFKDPTHLRISKQKFNVGNALSWAQRDDKVAVAGSFLREPRLAVLSSDSNGDYQLSTTHTFANPEKLRVVALAFITPGVPSFNTKEYFVIFREDGVGLVYNLASLSNRNEAEVVCTFRDDAYAGVLDEAPVRMITAVSNVAYKEELNIGLVRGASMTVHKQQTHAVPFTLVRMMDIHEPQEGDAIKKAVFIQGGKAVATCGDADGRHVQIFRIPE